MKELVRLKEIPLVEFTSFERFKHFRTMLEIDRVVMVAIISFIIIFSLISAAFFLLYTKENVKAMGRVIVIVVMFATVFIIKTSQTFLPNNTYDLYLYTHEKGDKLFENLDNMSESYLYRGEFLRVNGSVLEEIEKDTVEFNVTRK